MGVKGGKDLHPEGAETVTAQSLKKSHDSCPPILWEPRISWHQEHGPQQKEQMQSPTKPSMGPPAFTPIFVRTAWRMKQPMRPPEAAEGQAVVHNSARLVQRKREELAGLEPTTAPPRHTAVRAAAGRAVADLEQPAAVLTPVHLPFHDATALTLRLLRGLVGRHVCCGSVLCNKQAVRGVCGVR